MNYTFSIVLALISLFSESSLSQDKIITWENYKGKKEFVDYGGITISFDCLKRINYTCQAKAALNDFRRGKKIKLDLSGGKRPVTTLCYRLKGVTSLYRTSIKSKKYEESFCDFEDGSSVSAGDLWRAYLQ